MNWSTIIPALYVYVWSLAIGTTIGHAKGSGIGGFMLALFLGPVGCIVAYMLPPSFPPCVRCGTPHDPAYKVCHACGRPRPTYIVCPECQQKIDVSEMEGGTSHVCPHCDRAFRLAA
jgi:hypothetical protein